MELKSKLLSYAGDNNLKVNSKSFDSICRMLQINIDKHGEPYCPCRPIKNEDSICPCKFHLDEIENNGHCHCNLFIK